MSSSMSTRPSLRVRGRLCRHCWSSPVNLRRPPSAPHTSNYISTSSSSHCWLCDRWTCCRL